MFLGIPSHMRGEEMENIEQEMRRRACCFLHYTKFSPSERERAGKLSLGTVKEARKVRLRFGRTIFEPRCPNQWPTVDQAWLRG